MFRIVSRLYHFNFQHFIAIYLYREGSFYWVLCINSWCRFYYNLPLFPVPVPQLELIIWRFFDFIKERLHLFSVINLLEKDHSLTLTFALYQQTMSCFSSIDNSIFVDFKERSLFGNIKFVRSLNFSGSRMMSFAIEFTP